MTFDLRAVLLLIAVVLFALTGFGLVNDREHFHLVSVGLAFFAASFLPFRGART